MQKAKIVKWGNSQGIRIPKMLLDTLGFTDSETVELEVVEGKLVMSKVDKEIKAFGALSHLANSELREQEEGAWQREVVQKYEADRR